MTMIEEDPFEALTRQVDALIEHATAVEARLAELSAIVTRLVVRLAETEPRQRPLGPTLTPDPRIPPHLLRFSADDR